MSKWKECKLRGVESGAVIISKRKEDRNVGKYIKRTVCLGMVGMVLAVVLLACRPPAPPSEIRIAGGPAGGAMAMKQEAIAEVIRKSNPGWQARVISGVASQAALSFMHKGEMELGILTTDLLVEVIKGTFGGEPMDTGPLKVTTISPSITQVAGLLLLEKVPVNSLAEIKQKQYPIKISVGPRPSIFEIRNRRVLEAYGITYADIEKWGGKVIFQGDTPTMDMMRDGLAEAFVNFGTHPSALAQELATTRPLKFFTVSDAAAIDLMEKKYGYLKTTLKAGLYPFVKNDMTTVMSLEVHVALASLEERIAYNVARSIWENREFLGNAYPVYRELLTATYISAMDEVEKKFNVPVHPGARNYYKEQGLLK